MRHYHKDNSSNILTALGALAATILIGILMSGCSPKTQPVVVRETRTVLETDSLTRLITRLIASGVRETDRETVYVFDKTTYTVNENGDTVGKDRDRVTDRNREWQSERTTLLAEIDSLRKVKSRVDSIVCPVPYPVERTLSKWEQTKMDFGGMAIGGVVALCVAAIALAVWLIKTKRNK